MMTMDNLKKVAKVMVSIFILVYKLVTVLIFAIMIFSPKTYMKILYKIMDIVNAIVDKLSNIKNKNMSNCKGEI